MKKLVDVKYAKCISVLDEIRIAKLRQPTKTNLKRIHVLKRTRAELDRKIRDTQGGNEISRNPGDEYSQKETISIYSDKFQSVTAP